MNPKNILVFNCGSSSLNYKIYQSNDNRKPICILNGKAHRVGVTGSEPSFVEHHWQDKSEKAITPISNHREAAVLILKFIAKNNFRVDAIGHRFVHGGAYFNTSALLNEENLLKLTECLPLAPIHNPNSMSVIQECIKQMPDIQQYAAFDTAFHASIPDWAYTYALPKEINRKYGLRKYGFHGLSYLYVSREIAEYLNTPLTALRVIACHLGTGGSSIVAINNGQSLDTSMGFSPLPGLMMSTRTGDLDPLILPHLMEYHNLSSEKLNKIVNKESGLLGISGFSSDIRDISTQMENGNETARLAFDMYVYRLKKYIGAYATLLGGVDVLAFTDDIGILSWQVRQQVCQGLDFFGISIQEKLNKTVAKDKIYQINKTTAPVKILTVPTDEELIICIEGLRLIGEIIK